MTDVDEGVRRRSDAVRSRTLITDAVERLLRGGRVDFSVPELANEAGVGVATAYRHFATPAEALDAFNARAAGQLADAFGEVEADLDPLARFRRSCAMWVTQAQTWGEACRRIRSPKGMIERLHADDPPITQLYGMLSRVLEDLVAGGYMPKSDPQAAALMWTTIFDERVIYDLGEHHGWSAGTITDYLTTATEGALRIGAGTAH
jgi:AcrR family transcriptional regulator